MAKTDEQMALFDLPRATIRLLTHDGREIEYPAPKSPPHFNLTEGDGISWARYSWNPVTGCLHDCSYCYARDLAHSARLAKFYPDGFAPLFHPERLVSPRVTPVPKGADADPSLRRVFVVSMGDLYGSWVPDEWLDQIHAAMKDNPQWQYITLTKFPARYAVKPPPPGAWVGTSVDEQKRVRIAERAMARIEGAAVKWLSLEPLLAPLEFNDLSMFQWVVIGAQTATHQPDGKGGFNVVPAFDPPRAWIERLVDRARAAGCRIHMKPNLRRAWGAELIDEYPDGAR